jgi:tRNA modification GTPase
MLYDDTIAAVATPNGTGGVGIVRLSGPQAIPILTRVFTPARRGAWQPYRMRYGRIVDAAGATVDEALAVCMRAPRSFTAEHVVEISCHGGPLVVGRVLALALANGARLAEPGEFTLRAFLNGRIDLTQAEATLDIVNARTSQSLALAQAQLGGWLSNELRAARELLLPPLAYCTALVDFPEDEVEPTEIVAPIRKALAVVERLIASAEQGIVYRQGARAAIIGRPNAGKSSLLNALLRADRAIVTPIPGTTRDTLEETAALDGVPVVLVDTAGITATDDPVERIGVQRSRQALAQADLALLVLDAMQPIGEAEREIIALAENTPTVLVWNKVDLLGKDEGRGQRAESLSSALYPLPSALRATVAVSSRTGAGIDELAQAVAHTLLGGPPTAEARLITSPRHREALARAAELLRDALAGHACGTPHDLLAMNLTAALAALGEITGEAVGEDLLRTIFSRFCIGK